MPKTIISDTSCFIVLVKIDVLYLLSEMYGIVFTTNVVVEEFGETLPDWVEILNSSDISQQKILELQIDKGEASCIALALEISDCTIILDDDRARKMAKKLGLSVVGTLGVRVKAKLTGIIPVS